MTKDHQDAQADTKTWNAREFLIAARRHRWLLLAPLFALGLGGAALTYYMPAQYRSEALIQIQQQQVPARYVAPNVTTTAADRLQAIKQEILSRTRLQSLIESMNLYPNERAHMPMDKIVDRMAADVTVTTVVAPDAPDVLTGFRIAYLAPSAAVAQRVVNQLSSLFISDNLTARAAQSASTTNFLQSQLKDAEQNLQQRGDALRAFKLHNLGQLPEQEQGNLEILSSLQTEYNSASNDLDRAQQEKAYYESVQAQYAADPHAAHATLDPDSPQAKLETLEAKLAQLEATHTDKYPDVVATKQEIARWKAIAAATPAPAGKTGTPANAAAGQPVMIEAASRLQALDLEIASRRKDMADLQNRIKTVQQGLSITPVREQELDSLTQAFNDAQKSYQSLLTRTQDSQLATDLEESQQGERFQLVDPASLPRSPVSPNRPLLLIGGWLLGLLAGCGLVFLREYTDSSLRGEAGVACFTSVPVLASIPQLTSPLRGRRVHRRWLLEASAVSLLAVLAVASVVFNLGIF
ncbi:MAG TPA: GNVR domain-containing protein [Terriglobales bacterium]|nr:GNVR domain-containing protein [Terriglobales bacterium]